MEFELKQDILDKKKWSVILYEDDKEYIGNPPVCYKCNNAILEFPIYICDVDRYKWFCKDCQIQKGETKEKLCKWELILEEHEHICVKEIIDNTQQTGD